MLTVEKRVYCSLVEQSLELKHVQWNASFAAIFVNDTKSLY